MTAFNKDARTFEVQLEDNSKKTLVMAEDIETGVMGTGPLAVGKFVWASGLTNRTEIVFAIRLLVFDDNPEKK